jgi:hypothetical protein
MNKNISVYKENTIKSGAQTIFTKINIDQIDDIIHKILDKHSDICKYYFNIDKSYWGVSFNVGQDQIEAMCQTMFKIYLYKDEYNKSVIVLSKEITEHSQWGEVYNNLSKM